MIKKRFAVIALGSALLMTSALPAFAQETRPPVAPTADRATVKAAQGVLDAIRLFEGGQLENAIKALEAIRTESPTYAPARDWLAYLYMKANRFEDAVSLLEQAVEAEPENGRLWLSLGEAYQRTNRGSFAIVAYEEALKLGENGKLKATLGSLYLEEGETDKAIAMLEQAITEQGAGLDVLTNLGVAYLDADRMDDASRVFSQVLERDSNNRIALSWLGYISLSRGENEMAIEYLTRARAVDRNDLEVLNNLGAAYLRTEKFTAATDVFESIVSLRPDLFEPLYNLGVCYQQNNRHADALNAYNRALEIRPDDPFAWNNKGRAHESLGQLREAAQAYSRASDLRPTEIVFARNATVMLSKAGMAGDAARYMERVNQLGGDSSIQMVSVEGMVRAGQFQEADALLASLEGTQAGNAGYWYNRGVVASALGRGDDAIRFYRQAYEMDPQDVDTLNNLGLLYYGMEQFEEALPLFQEQVRLNPTSFEARMNLAATLSRTGKMTEAVELWRQLVRENPRRNDVRLDLANGLWTIGEAQQARFHYATILQSDARNAGAHNGMGLWHLLNAKNADAEASFRTAMSIDKNLYSAYNNLAVALERQNKRAQAILVLEQVLQMKPDFAEAQRNLQRMKAAEG